MNQYAKAMAAYGQARRAQSPVVRVVEVFDGALANVARAKAARAAGRRDEEFNAMALAARLLQEMEGCLDTQDDRVRAMSTMLSGFYRRTIMQLHGAVRGKGEGALARYASIYRQLVSMRNAWAQIAGVSQLPQLQWESKHSETKTEEAAKISE